MTAYFFYSQSPSVRAAVEAENPGLQMIERSKVIGVRWKALDEEGKKPYEAKAAADKERYAQEMKDYVVPQWLVDKRAEFAAQKKKAKYDSEDSDSGSDGSGSSSSGSGS